MSTLIIAAISGLGGAIAGGLVSLCSQILVRKWQKEDSKYEERKLLYSKIASIGADYIGQHKIIEINGIIANALLICESNNKIKFVEYVHLITKENRLMNDKPSNEQRNLIDNCRLQNVKVQQEVLQIMRKELKLE